MLNHIVIMGRLCADPALRRTQTGTPVANFSLAVERDFKDATGDRGVDFIDVIAWRSTAEFVSRWFTKGRMAVVEGRLQVRDWTDKNGNKRRSAEVIADSVYFGDSRRDDSLKRDDWTRDVPPPGGHQFNDMRAVPGEPMEQQEFSELVTDGSKLPF